MTKYILDEERLTQQLQEFAALRPEKNFIASFAFAVRFLNIAIDAQSSGNAIESVLPVKLVP